MITEHEHLIEQIKAEGTLAEVRARCTEVGERALDHPILSRLDRADLLSHLEADYFCPDCCDIHAGPCYPAEPVGLDKALES